MSVRNLATLDRDIFQPLGRIIQEAFADGLTGTGSITMTRSFTGAGTTTWLRGIVSSITMSGDGDASTKINPIQAEMVVDGAISSAYGIAVSAIHKSADDVSGAMAAANFDLRVQDEDFEAVQTLQTLVCTMSSDANRTVTCTSENWNLALFKNTANVDGLNAIAKLVDLGENTTTILEVESGDCDQFMVIDGSAIVADSSAVPNNATYKIKCSTAGTTFYLIGVADF